MSFHVGAGHVFDIEDIEDIEASTIVLPPQKAFVG